MSGGHFDYENGRIAHRMGGRWRDEELNELFFDLFGGGCDGYRTPFARQVRRCEFGRVWDGPDPYGGGAGARRGRRIRKCPASGRFRASACGYSI